MAEEVLKRDQNHITVLGGVTDDINQNVTMLRVDSITKRLLVSATGSGSGSVSSVSVVTANGFAGSVANPTTTPAITLSTTITGILSGNGTAISAAATTGSGSVVLATSPTLITPTLGVATVTSVNGNSLTTGTGTLTLSTFTLTVTGAASISGVNTGDQTNISGNAGTATALQNARTIGGVSFNGTANITVVTATGGFTISGGDLAIGANNLTITGSIGATGARSTKGWFTDLEVTNAPTLNGVAIPSISSINTLTNKFITPQLQSVADAGGTLTPVAITNDEVIATALSQATTIAAPSGSPVQGEKLIIRLKDNGTARALTWNAIYRVVGCILPTTTVISKLVYIGCIYNSTDTKWDVVCVAQEA